MSGIVIVEQVWVFERSVRVGSPEVNKKTESHGSPFLVLRLLNVISLAVGRMLIAST